MKRFNTKSCIWSITKEDLIKIKEKSNSITKMLDYMNLSRTSKTTRKNLKIRLEEENIDISSFNNRNKFRNSKSTGIPNEEWFVENSHHGGHSTKNRLFKLGWENKCSWCGIGEWRGTPLSLHLDHIDGNNKNNLLGNLRLLCPNCHSQTNTYCGKNKPKKWSS